MGRSIVKQPDGKYSMWSSIVDDFIHTDLTKDEYIEIRAKEAYEEKKEEMEGAFKEIEANPNSRYLKDYKHCLKIRKWNK